MPSTESTRETEVIELFAGASHRRCYYGDISSEIWAVGDQYVWTAISLEGSERTDSKEEKDTNFFRKPYTLEQCISYAGHKGIQWNYGLKEFAFSVLCWFSVYPIEIDGISF
jgi:hypothetical protein